MIPKIIHYCWFGPNPLPKSAQRCIASWRKFFPDYEIKEWNEYNFNVNMLPYTKDAYEAKKYAFVSDVARFWVLYNYGGLYFDTDVEVIKPMDDIIAKGAFMGWELPNSDGKSSVAPGLCLGSEKGDPLYKEILDKFASMSFWNSEGKRNTYSMVPMVTDLLIDHGLKHDGTMQKVDGTTIYPSDYFCPMDPTTGIVEKTPNTVSIHWYDSSWMNQDTICFKLHLLKNSLNRLLGKKFAKIVGNLKLKL